MNSIEYQVESRPGNDPADSLDIVIPSLPGFGSSDKPKQLGRGGTAAASLQSAAIFELTFIYLFYWLSPLLAGSTPTLLSGETAWPDD